MSRYSDYLDKKICEYGERFDNTALAPQFIPYFNSGERVEVKFSDGEVKRGTIGVTTGWRPVFLLMLTRRSHGSIYTLNNQDRLVKVIGQ